MWDEDKQRRLDDLQRRAQHSTLSAEEQQVLDQLLLALESAEWTAMEPALRRLRDEQEALQADLSRVQTQNALLVALTDRYADLLARAKVQLDGLARERDALRTEYQHALQDVMQP